MTRPTVSATHNFSLFEMFGEEGLVVGAEKSYDLQAFEAHLAFERTKRYLEDLERIERGEDPKAVVRDPVINRRIDLPIFDRHYMIDGPTREQTEDPDHPRANSTQRFIFQAGQPEEVRKAYVEAMGFQSDSGT